MIIVEPNDILVYLYPSFEHFADYGPAHATHASLWCRYIICTYYTSNRTCPWTPSKSIFATANAAHARSTDNAEIIQEKSEGEKNNKNTMRVKTHVMICGPNVVQS